jgi:hypothetical protein
VTVWPTHLQDVPFDFDAADRARWAIDETIRRLEVAADNRWRLWRDIRCVCEGGFVEHLDGELTGATTEAGWVVERLRAARAMIDASMDAAVIEQVRLELRRQDWLAEQARLAAQRALAARQARPGEGAPAAVSSVMPAAA